MSDEDGYPFFFLATKTTGKRVHKYMHGNYTFYRRDLKNTSYATFSCSIKECKARMSCRYSSKEAAQDSEEEPQLLR